MTRCEFFGEEQLKDLGKDSLGDFGTNGFFFLGGEAGAVCIKGGVSFFAVCFLCYGHITVGFSYKKNEIPFSC